MDESHGQLNRTPVFGRVYAATLTSCKSPLVLGGREPANTVATGAMVR